KPERLKSFDATRLDAVGLAQRQTAIAALDDAGVHVWELRHLGGEKHPGRPRTHNEHVHFVWQFGRSVNARAGDGEYAWVAGNIPVMVELHRCGSFLTIRSYPLSGRLWTTRMPDYGMP